MASEDTSSEEDSSNNLQQPAESASTPAPDDAEVENRSLVAAGESDGLQDELPEFEPLTPELVEEEAIRGDFMLRWAAVFLALLFGFSKLADTRTLVQIRSGDQMRASGFVPPRVESLSFSADGQPLSNVSWLFDLLLSFLWSLGGENALTLFKAAVAAFIAYRLVNISIAGMPTWWNSICAVFAIVACSADFTATTELMTLLGMVLLLSLLHRHREGEATGLVWKLPLLIAVWSNLDSRAWIGSLVVVLFATGGWFGRRRLMGMAAEPNALAADQSSGIQSAGQPGRGLGMCAAGCVLALLVNPFPLNSLLSPTTIYSVEYPAMQDQRPVDSRLAAVSFDGRADYFSLLLPDAFLLFDHSQIAGLALLLIAVVVLVLSRDVHDTAMTAALAGLVVLAVLASHELPVAAMTAAIIGGTSAQRWYRRNYSLQYSLDPTELLISRGGRAVTVFALACLGFCVVAGRLPGNTPVGWGFERETKTTIDTLGVQLQDIDASARILHTRIDQGDILIWHGRKSMIDSRLVPFGRPSDPSSVISRHKAILVNQLQTPPPAEDDDQRRQQEEARVAAEGFLRELNPTHAMPRLSPPGEPDYRSVQRLVVNPEWVLVSLGASAALFEKVQADISDEQRAGRLPQFGKKAFQEVRPVPVSRPDFAREPTFYQKYVYRERPFRDEHLRLGSHYVNFSQGQVQSIEQAVTLLSMNMLAIRHLQQSLYLDPQNSPAYQQLGKAYQQLDYLETLLSGDTGDTGRQDLRYRQAIMAFRQSLKGNPQNAETWLLLFYQYMRRQKVDLASECLDHWLPLQEDRLESIDDEARQKEMFDAQRQLKDSIAEQEQRLEEFLLSLEEVSEAAERAGRISGAAAALVQSGFDRRALQLLEDHDDLLRLHPDPMATVLKGQLQLESGQLEQGFTILNQLGSIAREQPATFAGVRWHQPAAASQISVADYTSAIDYLTAQLDELELAVKSPEMQRNLLLTLPLLSEASLLPEAMLAQWPVGHLSSMVLPAQGFANARAEARFLIALCHIEEGNIESARLILRAILAECGNTQYRPLTAQYLLLLDDKGMEFINQNVLNDWQPIEPENDPAADSDSAGDTEPAALPDSSEKPAAEPDGTP